MPTTIAELSTEVTTLLTGAGVFALIGLVAGFYAVIRGGGQLVRKIVGSFR